MRVGPRRHRSVAFRGGLLELEGPGEQSARLCGWPPEAWRRDRPNGCWSLAHPALRLRELEQHAMAVRQYWLPFHNAEQVLGDDDVERSAWAAFVRQIPVELRALIAAKFIGGDWGLLLLACDTPGAGAHDLMVHSPATALLITLRERFAVGAEEIPGHQMVYWKQRDILGALGFPPTKAAVKLLRRVRRTALRPPVLLRLRDLINDPATSRGLGHLEALNGAVVEVMGAPQLARRVTPRFLVELSLVDQPATEQLAVRHLRFLADASAEVGCLPRGWRVGSLQQLHALAADVRADIVAERQARAVRFPPSPLPGTATEELVIEPVATGAELLREGRENRNCIFSYADRVARAEGSTYVYRVLSPQRATLVIARPTSADAYHIEGLKGFGNAEPRRGVADLVHRWLAAVDPARERERRRAAEEAALRVPPSAAAITTLIATLSETSSEAEANGLAMTLATFCARDERVTVALLKVAGDPSRAASARIAALQGLARRPDGLLFEQMKAIVRSEADRDLRHRMAVEVFRAETALLPAVPPAPPRRRRVGQP